MISVYVNIVILAGIVLAGRAFVRYCVQSESVWMHKAPRGRNTK